jgi:hypothetical protein
MAMLRSGGVPGWMQYKRQLQLLPPLSTARDSFGGKRIPRLPPTEEGDTPPGRICWGTVGNLPSPEPLPTVNFQVTGEQWKEWGRKTEKARIENPDDPEQYIMVDRATESVFEKREDNSQPGPNTATQPAPGIAEYFNDNPRWKVVDDGKESGKMIYVKVNYEGVAPQVAPPP